MCELRTMPQGHPDYRFICQEMWRKIQEVHPTLAEAGKFIHWGKYRLGRLQSEIRTEFKKSAYVKRKNKLNGKGGFSALGLGRGWHAWYFHCHENNH
jgi:thymidylate synthase ThyX